MLRVHPVSVGSFILGGGNDAVYEVVTDLTIRRKVFRGREWPAAEGGLMAFDRHLFGDLNRLRIAIEWRRQVSRGHCAG